MVIGEVIGVFVMIEFGVGFDFCGIKMIVKKVDGGYVVNGVKMFILFGVIVDFVVIFVKIGEGNCFDVFSLVLIENGMEGFDYGKKLYKMGF